MLVALEGHTDGTTTMKRSTTDDDDNLLSPLLTSRAQKHGLKQKREMEQDVWQRPVLARSTPKGPKW